MSQCTAAELVKYRIPRRCSTFDSRHRFSYDVMYASLYLAEIILRADVCVASGLAQACVAVHRRERALVPS